MNAEPAENPIAPPAQELRLVQAQPDFRTVKSQMTVASIVGFIAAILLHAGLISHPLATGDTAFLEEIHETIAKTGLSGALEHLPAWSASGFGDGAFATLIAIKTAWLGLVSASWQHGINVFILGMTAIFVAQITIELAGRKGNRMAGSAPIWAALLFTCAPIQIELLMRLSDRAELLCGLFYSAAIFFYLRFRTTQRKLFLRLGLVSTLFCIFTRPEALTLPIAITAAELLLPPVTTENPHKRKPAVQRFLAVALFWLVLSFTATVGRLAPHVVPLLQAPSMLSATAIQTGWADILPLLAPGAKGLLIPAFALLLVSLIWQTIASRFEFSFGTVGFLVVWLAAASPTLFINPSQITEASPSTAVAPWAILLTLCALPALCSVSRKSAAKIAILGSLALSLLTASWFITEQNVSDDALTHKTEFIWPASYNFTGTLQPVFSFKLSGTHVAELTYDPPDAVRPTGSVFNTERASITPMSEGVRIMPGQNRLRVWLPQSEIDNHTGAVAGLRMLYTSKSGCHTCHSDSLKLIWQNEMGNVGRASIIDMNFGQYLVWLSRYPEWTNAKKISRLGFEFEPGDYWVDVSRLDLVPYLMTAPALAISVNDTFIKQTPSFKLPRSVSKPTIHFTVAQVPNAIGAKVIIDKGTTNFQAEQEKDLYALEPPHPSSSGPLMEGDFKSPEAGVYIPENILKAPGKYQIRAIALNNESAEIGLPTEPWVIEIE